MLDGETAEIIRQSEVFKQELATMKARAEEKGLMHTDLAMTDPATVDFKQAAEYWHQYNDFLKAVDEFLTNLPQGREELESKVKDILELRDQIIPPHKSQEIKNDSTHHFFLHLRNGLNAWGGNVNYLGDYEYKQECPEDYNKELEKIKKGFAKAKFASLGENSTTDFVDDKFEAKIELPRKFPDVPNSLRLRSDFISIIDAYKQEFPQESEKMRPGSWRMLLGYLSTYIGGDNGLQKGDLEGFKIADIGGGTYGGNSYGPNLSKVLNFLGSDVSLVDPRADEKDFADSEQVRLIREYVEYYADKQGAKDEFDLAVSCAVLGSPGMGQNKVKQYIDKIAKLSPLQIHYIQFEEIKTDRLEEIVQQIPGARIITSKSTMDNEVVFNLLIVDKRKEN
ncbi:MAG: hypothetical protein ABIH87_04830 [bacterium]